MNTIVKTYVDPPVILDMDGMDVAAALMGRPPLRRSADAATVHKSRGHDGSNRIEALARRLEGTLGMDWDMTETVAELFPDMKASPGDEVDRRARQRAQKDGTTYREALHAVLDADPALKAAYAGEITRPSWVKRPDE